MSKRGAWSVRGHDGQEAEPGVGTLLAVASRAGLIAGPLVCLAMTPSFALAYFDAYGYSQGESPMAWLSAMDIQAVRTGSDAVATYNRLGVAFGVALSVAVVSLAVVMLGRAGRSMLENRAWLLIVAGLGAVALGSLGEYGAPALFQAGFAVELLGFVILAVGTGVLGLALYRDRRVGIGAAIVVALSGLFGVIAGGALVGHIPSGPSAPFLLAVFAVGLRLAGTRTDAADTAHAAGP